MPFHKISQRSGKKSVNKFKRNMSPSPRCDSTSWLLDILLDFISHSCSVKCHPTVIHIRNNCNPGGGELGAQTAPHGHAQGDIEALVVFVQRVVNDHHAAGFFHLALVKAQDAVVVFGPGDVIWVWQHSGGHRTCGWHWDTKENLLDFRQQHVPYTPINQYK